MPPIEFLDYQRPTDAVVRHSINAHSDFGDARGAVPHGSDTANEVAGGSVQPRLEQRLGELQLPHNPLMGDTPLLEKCLDLLLGIFP